MKILYLVHTGLAAVGFVTKNILSLWDRLGIVPDKTPGLRTANRV